MQQQTCETVRFCERFTGSLKKRVRVVIVRSSRMFVSRLKYAFYLRMKGKKCCKQLTLCNSSLRMKTSPFREPKVEPNEKAKWPRKVQPGRDIVTVYRRKTPRAISPTWLPTMRTGRRRSSTATPAKPTPWTAADTLAKRMDNRDYVAASMTQEQAIEYANAVARLKPFNVTVDAATSTVAECLKTVADLSNLHAAVKFYAARHKQTIRNPWPRSWPSCLRSKRLAALPALRWRTCACGSNRFAGDCNKDCCNVTTADLQAWLDAQNAQPTTEAIRRVTQTFVACYTCCFEFAVARGYASDNPVEGVERIKVRNGDVEIFTPVEIARACLPRSYP